MDLTMYRGDTPTWELAVTNAAGAPYNLTGCTIRMMAKRAITDADSAAVLDLSTAGGEITITDAAGGRAEIVPPAADTAGLIADVNALYDVQITTGTSRVHTVASGRLLIRRDVTRTSP